MHIQTRAPYAHHAGHPRTECVTLLSHNTPAKYTRPPIVRGQARTCQDMPGHVRGQARDMRSRDNTGHGTIGQRDIETIGHRDNTGHQTIGTPDTDSTPAHRSCPPLHRHSPSSPPPTAHSSWPPMRMRITGARYAHAHRPAVRRFWGRALSLCCFFSQLFPPPRFSFCGGIFALRCAAGADLQRPFLRAAVRCPRC